VTTVVGLGAWCEYVPPDRAQASPGSACFDVAEFAVLDDGRRLVLHQERGFAVSRSATGDPWTWLTAEGITSDVLTTVLPDEDDAADEHPYDWLCRLLSQRGVEVSVEELRAVPYVVELSDDVLARLSDARHETT
jgi:hypothetical protein